jgi:putative sporulation protein YtaF
MKNRNRHIDIIIDECSADCDNSKVLSLGEAMMLSVSLSLDSLASGAGAGLEGTNVIRTGIMALICGFIVMTAGEFSGRVLKTKSEKNFSWIGGAVLIMLAVIKIIP